MQQYRTVEDVARDTPGGPLAPFRQKAFRAIWTASVISNFGSLIQAVGAAWMMTTITHNPQMVALVQSSASLPIMLFALIAGAIADNYDRRRIMLAAQTLMAIVSGVLAGLTFAGGVTPFALLACTLLVGVGAAIHTPAWQASIRAQVPIEDLPAAVVLNAIGFNLARSLGPALGGALMATVGAAANFSVNALSYAGLIAVLLWWRPVFPPRKREPLIHSMREGVRIAFGCSPVRVAFARAAAFGLGGAGLYALIPLVAHTLLGGGETEYGLIYGAFGAGSIAGALLVGRLRKALGTERLVVAATLGFAAGAAGAALAPGLWAAMAATALAGAAWVSALSTFNVVVQLRAPQTAVGRCLSLYQMHAFGGIAIGSWIWGAVGEAHGIRDALLVSAGLLGLTALLGLWLRLPEPEGTGC